MKSWPILARGAALLGLVTAAFLTSAHAETIDLYGVDEVTLGWQPASGPAVGYYVIVQPSGADAFLQGVASEPQSTLPASPGDEFAVMVAAFDAEGVAGPVSLPSPTLRIHAAPAGDASPDSGDPAPDGGGADSPPPDDGDPGPKAPGTPYDFDGDGISDLLVREPSGGIAIWRMDGSAVLARDPIAITPESWQLVGGGDYDGDGVADLLWEDPAAGSLEVWLLRDGQVRAQAPVDLGALAPEDGWLVGGSGDFDGDGRDDVMLFSRILGESEILFFQDGAVASRAELPGHVGAWSVDATDDLDGDGVDEILWRDERLQELVLWDLDGAGAGTPVPLSQDVAGWRLAGAGDFDGDGRADLFAVDEESLRARVWLQDGASLLGVVELPTPDAGRVATHVGDYDFDGRADLVWSDPAGGDLEIWFSDGDGVTSEGVTGVTAGAIVLIGEEGSDDSEFRERLCDADFDDDQDVDAADFRILRRCLGESATGECRPVDLDGSGVVDRTDFRLFKRLLRGRPCGR